MNYDPTGANHASQSVYVSRKGKTYGPYSFDTAQAYLDEGKLSSEDKASVGFGVEGWRKLGELLSERAMPIKPLGSESNKQKVIDLLDRKEVDFAFDLVKGSDDPALYASLLKGAKVEDGILCSPDWVGWEGYRQSFFLRVMDAAPDSEHADQLRQGVRCVSMRFFEKETFPLDILGFEDLEYLHLRGGKMVSVPPEITRLSGLKDLHLEGVGLRRLPDELKDLKTLTRVDLPSNNLSGLNANLEVLGDLDGLEILVLDYNDLHVLPEGLLSSLTKLQVLSLNGNKFPEDRLESILSDLAGLPGLRELFLRRCEIESFPVSMDGFESLVKLDLAENELAKLPAWLGELTSLKWIDLAENPVQKELNWDKDVDFRESVN